MKEICRKSIDARDGWLVEVEAGQTRRLMAGGTVEHGYHRNDQAEWIDAARNRVYNLNVFPSAGHRLFSKQNNTLMRFAADGSAELGHHDLQAPPSRPTTCPSR
jgi:uncharacterized protein YcgI (DUF1989 family)